MIYNYEPYISEEDIDSVIDGLRTGIANPKIISDLESKLEQYFNSNACLCSTGTHALYSAAKYSNLENSVIACPAYTFAASWNIIKYVNAEPLFIDIKEDTWCIDEDELESHYTDSVKAVVAVNLLGNICDYKKIRKLLPSLYIIEDAAQSLGSTKYGKKSGTFGDVSCFSFNLNKLVTFGGGGLILSKNKTLIREIKKYINQSKNNEACDMDYLGIGNNYRMPPMNALLGISQFIRLEEILLKKEKIHNLYKRYLSNNFKMQKEESGVVSNKWLNVIQTDSEENKNKLIKKLRENNVEARGTYKSANLLPWFEYLNIKSPVSEHIYRTTISLPSGLLISEEQIKKICSIILN